MTACPLPSISSTWAMAQATEQAPIKPSQASRNSRGQVDLDNLSSDDLDYGCDVEGLASLRKRLKHAIGSYNGVALPRSAEVSAVVS